MSLREGELITIAVKVTSCLQLPQLSRPVAYSGYEHSYLLPCTTEAYFCVE